MKNLHLILLFVLLSCDSQDENMEKGVVIERKAISEMSQGSSDLSGDWLLIKMNGYSVNSKQSAEATLLIDKTNLSGKSFCNQYVSSINETENRIVIKGLATSKMYCNEVDALEMEYLNSLEQVTEYYFVKGSTNSLVLLGSKIELVYDELVYEK